MTFLLERDLYAKDGSPWHGVLLYQGGAFGFWYIEDGLALLECLCQPRGGSMPLITKAEKAELRGAMLKSILANQHVPDELRLTDAPRIAEYAAPLPGH